MRRRESQQGFVLLDALAALVVGAGVLAGVYALISGASRGSASARQAAYAATAASAFCSEVTANSLSVGVRQRTDSGFQLTALVSPEARPNLPAKTRLWRIDCAAQQGGVTLAVQSSYTLKAVPQESQQPQAQQPQQPAAGGLATPLQPGRKP